VRTNSTFARLTCALSVVTALLLQPAIAAGQKAASKGIPLSVWKTRTCGCCGLWVEHMKANGFDVSVQDVDTLDEIKKKLGITPALSSCHTALAGRYVIEGHIPADVVRRFLKEPPAGVVGLAVPGMPIGSPGMEVPGGRRQPYSVLTFDTSGRTSVYERR